MLGQLPTTLNVQGQCYKIRSDYRNILRIFEAFADDDYSDQEKLLICLKRIYVGFNTIPQQGYEEAYKQAYWFINCDQIKESTPPLRTFNWIKDAPILFPAVNKAAGMEVRAVPYLHWWTFMGYFQSIDGDSLFGTVLSIRQKKLKGKKLEKHERDFYNSNKALMALDMESAKERTAEEQMQEIFDSLVKGGE